MFDHDIVVAGKSSPNSNDLTAAIERGFDQIELYLGREHLDTYDETVRNVRNAAAEVVSVHTPHVPIDTPEYLQAADNLADELDAYLVVHSNRIIHTHTQALEDLGFQSDYGYENNPGVSVRHIQNMILERGYDLVLDLAHMFMAEAEYLDQTTKLLQDYPNQIPIVHLCDSTLTEDGLGFGKGIMEMERVVKVLEREFEGIVVLEVMPDEQVNAKQKFERWY